MSPLLGLFSTHDSLGGSVFFRGIVPVHQLWGPQVDQLFADEQVTTPTSEGNVLWLLGDQGGTLRDTADYNGTSYTIPQGRLAPNADSL